MIVNKQFAKKIEDCIKQSHINVAQRNAELGLESDILDIGGGAACFLGKESFLSQVIGWGFDPNTNAVHKQLKLIEKFYLTHDFFTVNIELSPL